MHNKRLSKRERRVLKQQNITVIQPEPFTTQLKDIVPLTKAQQEVFNCFNKGNNLVLHGLAGTGKSFISLYLALRDLISGVSNYNQILIVRSVVPTREMGFLPGNMKDKIKVYEQPYSHICTELFNRGDAYSILKGKNYVEFTSTSFIRGLTFDNTLMVIDEIQNMTGGEIDSIITRVGKDSRVIICGDYRQSDLQKETDKRGLHDFFKIIKSMNEFKFIEFNEEDIVRSGLVKNYIITKNKMNITF